MIYAKKDLETRWETYGLGKGLVRMDLSRAKFTLLLVLSNSTAECNIID
jgi:hypothetical protein